MDFGPIVGLQIDRVDADEIDTQRNSDDNVHAGEAEKSNEMASVETTVGRLEQVAEFKAFRHEVVDRNACYVSFESRVRSE